MPLTGRRILITRTRQQASELAALLESAGAEPILIPTIELAPPTSFTALDTALAMLDSFDWLIFTSANAIQSFATRAKALGIQPAPKRIAVIGPATARAVQSIGLTPDLIPPQFVAEALAEALKPFAPQASMLLIRAEQARDILPEALTAAGAQLTIAAAYSNIIPPASITALQELFANPAHHPDAVTFTSSSTASNLFALLEAANLKLPPQIVRASIGPVTSHTLEELGYPAIIEASEPTIAALATALAAHFRGPNHA
jgi:uroporphyrinogen-III synthase